MADTSRATNPFDDGFDEGKIMGNPFASPNPFDSPDDEESSSQDTPVDDPIEASWQYLGELPFRRVPIYTNMKWGKESGGLAAYPHAVLGQHPNLQPHEVQRLLEKTTTTQVAACPHGGPVGLCTLPIAGTSLPSTTIRILTNAGQPLAEVPFGDAMYTAADMSVFGFTRHWNLVILAKDTRTWLYDLTGELLMEPFLLGERGSVVQKAIVYASGVAILLQDQNSILCEFSRETLTDSMHAKRIPSRLSEWSVFVTPLPTAERAQKHFHTYITLCVIEGKFVDHGYPEVMLSTSDRSIVVCRTDTLSVVDVDCRTTMSSPIVDMVPAPNGRFLACFLESCLLAVIGVTFEQNVLEFDTSDGSAMPPQALAWCGEDSVLLHWKKKGVLMVGPLGDYVQFPFDDDSLHLMAEMDCCRVISDTSIQILQRVPKETASLLCIGSIDEAALLVDAADAFAAGSPSSEETARAIEESGKLSAAMESCLEAALREFDIDSQKRLLRATSYGMHFQYRDDENAVLGGPVDGDEVDNPRVRPNGTARNFVEAARKLRILNALRNPSVGIVVTAAQYDSMTAIGVVARLIAVKKAALASSISAYLGLPRLVQLHVRAARASALFDGATHVPYTDAQLAEAAVKIISDNVKENPTTSDSSLHRGAYATVSRAANKAGRPGVAKLLLTLESSVADKVPVLLETGAYAEAMAVATQARDAAFIFEILMDFQKSCQSDDMDKSMATFLSTVVAKFTPEGFHTLRQYLEHKDDVKSACSLMLRAQQFAGAGSLMARKALKETDMREKQTMLVEASRIFSRHKDTAFHKECTENYLDLLRDQEVLRTKYGSPDVAPKTSSLAQTITSVITFAATHVREQHKLLADADKIAKKYRVPEKRYWYLKVQAFAESQQWSNLRILSESRTKSPIGFKPFARAAIKGQQTDGEILRYIERASPEEQHELLCEAKMWEKALQQAFRYRDEQGLMKVKNLCNSAEIQLKADELLGRLA